MPMVSVEVEVDARDVMRGLDDDDLCDLDLVRFDSRQWIDVADAIRRGDFLKAAEIVTSIAADTGGVDLPPFVVARVA